MQEEGESAFSSVSISPEVLKSSLLHPLLEKKSSITPLHAYHHSSLRANVPGARETAFRTSLGPSGEQPPTPTHSVPTPLLLNLLTITGSSRKYVSFASYNMGFGAEMTCFLPVIITITLIYLHHDYLSRSHCNSPTSFNIKCSRNLFSKKPTTLNQDRDWCPLGQSSSDPENGIVGRFDGMTNGHGTITEIDTSIIDTAPDRGIGDFYEVVRMSTPVEGFNSFEDIEVPKLSFLDILKVQFEEKVIIIINIILIYSNRNYLSRSHCNSPTSLNIICSQNLFVKQPTIQNQVKRVIPNEKSKPEFF
ncbi:unnamed protein product [Larinioides sclopetarius]|uniref:Uncharacterized protein n=1 Tax=Larinioides sclopetarius TaxID=280406 RepID=A0AAV2A9V3_9ARAC